MHSGAHELLDLDSRNPQSGGGLGPIGQRQLAGIVTTALTGKDRDPGDPAR